MWTSARSRLLAAIASGGALAACPPAQGPGDGGLTASAASSSGSAAATSSSGSAAATSPVPWSGTPGSPTAPEPLPDGCTKAERYCLAPGTAPPSGAMGGDEVGPDPSMFDEHGCVRRELLGTTCNGLRPVNGPNFDGKECCYDVCHMPVPCGRPLIVRDEARVAPAARRADWCAELSGEVRATSVTLRDALRRAWLADAALEHASVASFARFSLELMAVGAPAALVAGAHAAALDEVEHARACYALAAAYGDERAEGARVGPGAMALDGLSLRIALLEVATAAVVEGCVGETIAACAALRAREFCADPVVAAVLERIAADELVHAELSYRFVAWALGKLGVGARPALRAAFERGLRQLEASEGPRPDELAAYRAAGRLDGDAFARVVRTARSEIVEPCMRALLDGSARAVVAEGVHASA